MPAPGPSQQCSYLARLVKQQGWFRDEKDDFALFWNDYFEMPHIDKRWEIRICDRNTREPHKIFSEIQDSFALHYLHTSLEKFASITVENTEPEHHNNKRKCDACNLKSFCDFRI